jgi:hypothetical protein
MPVNDRALFKAFQVFILHVLDALGHENDTEGDSSLPAAEREAAGAPVVARPRKAEKKARWSLRCSTRFLGFRTRARR